MNNQAPPPLPNQDSALRTYLRAVVLLIPTTIIWLFATIFLVPKLEKLWHDTGLVGSQAQWLMNISHGLKDNFSFIIAGVVAILLVLELRWAPWPRYRRVVVGCVTLFFNVAVLVGVTTIATAALLAAPLLLRHK